MSKLERACWILFGASPLISVAILAVCLPYKPIKPAETKVQFDDAAMKGWIDANLSEALERRGIRIYVVHEFNHPYPEVVVTKQKVLIIASSKEEAEFLFNEGKKK